MIPTSRRHCRHSTLRFFPQQYSIDRPPLKRLSGPRNTAVPETNSNLIGNLDTCADQDLLTPIWKRGSDILILLLILPIVAILAALMYGWVQLVSPGTVLFRQERIGRGGKPFTIYKFRSMKPHSSTNVHEAHVEHLIKSNKPMTKLDDSGDTRLIKGGRLIRTSGLDEIPQFINVLRGEMSLVGPRPCLPNEFALYEAHQRHRFAVQPGLTGLWQVSRNQRTTFSEMVMMDNDYVNSLSAISDFYIMLRTPFALIRQMKASADSRCQRPGIRPSSAKLSAKASSHPAYALSMSITQRVSD